MGLWFWKRVGFSLGFRELAIFLGILANLGLAGISGWKFGFSALGDWMGVGNRSEMGLGSGGFYEGIGWRGLALGRKVLVLVMPDLGSETAEW